MKKPKWIEPRPEVRRVTKVEAAWLAAVVDGEGSIGMYDYGREGRRVQIQLGNTSEAFVARFRELIGCGSTVFRVSHGKGHKGRQPMYHFTLKGSARCYAVLKQIVPFLIIKRERATAILRELEEKPFGRWVNTTEAAREKASTLAKAGWSDPAIRARRLAGMRKARRRARQ
ncbi:MAG: hypothetical protein ACKV2T_39510 [Kofleriaceae bacterium]